MTDLLVRTERLDELRNVHTADAPIDFETWLELSHRYDTELIKGVMVDRPSFWYAEAWLFGWLSAILGCYVHHRRLGLVLGCRTAVKIDQFDGRLPDILFVRAENAGIIQKKAIYGTPDLVVEIVSPSDTNSYQISLQADYRSMSVPEIVFIDPQKKHVRVARKGRNESYADRVLTSGRLTFEGVPGFWIDVEWLFADRQPDELDHATRLVREAEESGR
jgi:Uma2 family endonuclease